MEKASGNRQKERGWDPKRDNAAYQEIPLSLLELAVARMGSAAARCVFRGDSSAYTAGSGSVGGKEKREPDKRDPKKEKEEGKEDGRVHACWKDGWESG